jgi:hypothetical protein
MAVIRMARYLTATNRLAQTTLRAVLGAEAHALASEADDCVPKIGSVPI